MGHIFGPVPSRRLGFSLGVDVVPFKTCSFDCIYCQLGCTTRLFRERREWVPLDDLLGELRAKLDSKPDFITIGGSGEPTLYARLGELIGEIKNMTAVPVAVLTNGSMFGMHEVRDDLRYADIVAPSLDAGDADVFRTVNRPHPELSFEDIIDGMIAFRDAFAGQYWLEVLVLEGITDNPRQISKIAGHAARIRPDRVELNTVTRPPAEQRARGVSRERLLELARLFDPPAAVIAEFPPPVPLRAGKATEHDVLELIKRHPSSLTDIVVGLGVNQSEADRFIAALVEQGLVESVRMHGIIHYRHTHS